MKLSLNELKLAAALLLPDLIVVHASNIHWRDDYGYPGIIIPERDWLYVCWLCEKTFTRDECHKYHDILTENKPSLSDCAKGTTAHASRWTFHASIEQRLEAICRVKFPHLFNEPPAPSTRLFST